MRGTLPAGTRTVNRGVTTARVRAPAAAGGWARRLQSTPRNR